MVESISWQAEDTKNKHMQVAENYCPLMKISFRSWKQSLTNGVTLVKLIFLKFQSEFWLNYD